MNKLHFLSAALTALFLMVTTQSAFALNCPTRTGDLAGNPAAEYFLNAVNDTCGGASIGADPSNDGHIIVGGPTAVTIQFIENGGSFIPTSRSLSCTGASSTQDFSSSMRANFSAVGFSTSCSLSYTTPTGLLVTHSFNTASVLVSGTYVGSTSEFSATTGWFDRVAPSVVLSGVPTNLNGPTVFNATVTFDENVTGFEIGDITISGGVVTALTGSGAIYTATVSTTGDTDLVMSIGANVVVDGAGNGNLASGAVNAANVTARETSAVIAQFMQGRANTLLSNQPGLAGFLRGGDRLFTADVTRGVGNLTFSSGYNAPIWARLNVNWATNAGADSTTAFGALGGHANLSDNVLLGGMFQFDNQRETNGAALIKGTGWLVGPYFVAKLPDQKLYFEGSVLYGQTRNDISPLGTYSDSFTTDRWLATLGVSGEIVKDKITFIPFLDTKYTNDRQAAYVDSLGNSITKQSVEIWQISSGLDFLLPLSMQTTLTGGVSGVWSMNEGTGVAASIVPGFDGGRARVNLGVSHQISTTNLLALSGYYDGIGTPDFEGYSLELLWNVQF